VTAPALFVDEEPPTHEDPEVRLALRVLWCVIVVGLAALLAGYYCFTRWGP